MSTRLDAWKDEIPLRDRVRAWQEYAGTANPHDARYHQAPQMRQPMPREAVPWSRRLRRVLREFWDPQ